MPFIYSTLTAPQKYTGYVKGVQGDSIANREVSIAGGAGLANKHFITPLGTATEVTEDELQFLKSHPVFNTHQKNGFITIQTKKADVDKVATEMQRKDGSSPMTPGDFIHDPKGEPSVGAIKS